jgi:RNA polymerase sigma-70 factor, ECF subfamily
VRLGRQSTPINFSLIHTTMTYAQTITASPNALFAHIAQITVSWSEMISHRDYLVRFAQRKLHDPALAEDAVHDVFEAVMSGRASFEGRAALRSWLTAILKFKVVDIIRSRARYGSYDCFDTDEDQDGSGIEQLACDSPGPQEQAEQRELLNHTLKRIDTLPAGLRDVMQFRVLQDESSQEVCERLQISEASLFVRLHRARKQLLN